MSGDRLLGPSQLVDLSNQSSPASSVVDLEGQFKDLKEEVEELEQENGVVLLDEDMPMDQPAPSPCTVSHPHPPPTPSTSWINDVEAKERSVRISAT